MSLLIWERQITVVDSSGVFIDFRNPSINDSGQIAFVAELDDGTRGIYLASPVPIPASAWLFGSGLFGLFGIARRKKA